MQYSNRFEDNSSRRDGARSSQTSILAFSANQNCHSPIAGEPGISEDSGLNSRARHPCLDQSGPDRADAPIAHVLVLWITIARVHTSINANLKRGILFGVLYD